MKRCPACDRTYADEAALNFCLDDGAPLLHVESGSSYDPQQTLRIPATRPTEQRRTDVMPPSQTPRQSAALIQSVALHARTARRLRASESRRSSRQQPLALDHRHLCSGPRRRGGRRQRFRRLQDLQTPTVIVSKSGGGQYTTISEAIKNAKPGTRIMVRPGFYNEGLAIDKQLEIVGDGPLETSSSRARRPTAYEWRPRARPFAA